MEGIVNGMDTTDWSPNVDKFLDVKYDAETVDEGKALAKEALQAELGLPVSALPQTPTASRNLTSLLNDPDNNFATHGYVAFTSSAYKGLSSLLPYVYLPHTAIVGCLLVSSPLGFCGIRHGFQMLSAFFCLHMDYQACM